MSRTIVAVVVCLLLLVAGLGSWSLLRASPAPLESLAVGMETTAVNSLILIADARGFFAANGLNVTIREYSSGLEATNGMLAGEVDLAMAAEFVLVGRAFADQEVSAIASIDRFRHIHIVALKDRGIANPTDLTGRRIGVPRRTAAEFYLGRFLDLNNMSVTQVTLVDLPPAEAGNALATGDVDAVVTWQPFVRAIQDRLGRRVMTWPAQAGQASYCLALATPGWLGEHPERVNRFLAALGQAEDLLARDPAGARAIVQERLGYDDATMAGLWHEHQFSISLDQSLVIAMEDEARWMIANNLTSGRTAPDFRRHLFVQGLEAVRPGSVKLL